MTRQVSFSVYEGGAREASYDLDEVESAEWSEARDGLADLVLRLKNGEVRKHTVMTRTAINVCERVSSGGA